MSKELAFERLLQKRHKKATKRMHGSLHEQLSAMN